MSFIYKLTIRKQISLYIILFLILFAGIAVVTQYFLAESNKSEALSKNALLVKSMVQELKISEGQVLTEDIVNESFYVDGSSENVRYLQTAYEDIVKLLEETFLQQEQAAIDSNEVVLLLGYINNYKLSFDTLLNAVMVKGFKDHGITGSFRTSAHQAEDFISQLDNDRFTNYLLTLRRHEKDFLLRNDLTYVDRFNRVYNEFLYELENNQDEVVSESLANFLSDYANDFYSLVDIQKSINTSGRGILHRMDNHYQMILSVLNTIVASAETHHRQMLQNLRVILLIMLLAASLLVVILLSRLGGIVTKPLKSLEERINQLSTGDISENLVRLKGRNEISSMGNALNRLIQGLKETVNFANDIRNKKYHTDFKPLSEKDLLGKSLLEMRDNLIVADKEAQEQRDIEKQQNWINSGTAKFADILNQNYSNTNDFTFNIISNLVKFLDANQGGMFLINDDDEKDVHLELKSAFAYSRRKFMQKRVELEEGFIGASLMEKSIIYRTEIPDDYISITSGLGEANPNILIVVPLVLENEVYGAMEIASFHELKDYELEFVKKISESIASTISAVKGRERTEKLLVKTQDQAEQISQTEEEMRQNMEELLATQEEMSRRQEELEQSKLLMENLLDTIPLPVFVKDENCKYYMVNKEEAKLFKQPKNTIIGFTERDLVKDEISVHAAEQSDQKVLSEQETVELPEQHIKLNDGTFRVLKTIKIPFKNNITQASNILGISLETAKNTCEEELSAAKEKIRELSEKLKQIGRHQ